MNNKNFRLKIFKKIAQDITIPTEQVAAEKQIAPPPTFQASSMYPGINAGFNANVIIFINFLTDMLNTAIHYASGGTLNFQYFKNNSFNFDSSIAPSVDQKNLMNLSKKVFINLFNSGNAFTHKLTAKEVTERVNNLLNSQDLQNLSSISPTGPIAQKIPGNLKEVITLYLNLIKTSYIS